jgi:PCFT/HCP family folate transporter-like MFS transporter 1/3
MAISMALGTSLSGIVYNQLGFYGAYGLSSVLIIIGLVYGLLFVEEIAPITVVNENKSFKTTLTEFFNFKQVTESLKTTFKKRPNTQRLKIIVLLIILMANAGTNNGSF